VLALDYGSARCGCALSDPSGTLATPIEPVANAGSRRGLGTLAALVRDRGVELVLVGLPLTLAGTDSAQTTEAREFAQRLARRLGDAVAVEMYDERFTTRIAQRTPGARGSSEDSRAAALLLEDWLGARGR
jgi:putative Holliday junction resolvase